MKPTKPRKLAKSAIPVGTQFSPALVDLRAFLQAAIQHSGNKSAMQAAVWSPPVRTTPRTAPTPRRASLPLEAARQYGLLDDEYKITDLGRSLAKLNSPELHDQFAKHILLHRGGLRIVQAAGEMLRDGRSVTGDSLAEYLTDHGFQVTIHNTAINSLRMWLERAGIFKAGGWEVDEDRLEALIGLNRTEIAALAGLSSEQQAFLLALCRINPADKYPAADVRELAEQILGRRIPRDSLPKRVLVDLRDLGYLEFTSRGTAGGKSAILRTTDRFRGEVLRDFLRDAVKTLDPVLTAYFLTTPADIYAELRSSDKVKRGKALEAYAIHIMRLMGFRFVGWRKRAKDSTGKAEVDVLMTGLFGNSPTRWQVQCKNTPTGSVDLEDVAKEVGLISLTKATHILIIANSRFTADARIFAKEVMRASPLTVFLMDRTDFEKVRRSPGALAAILRSQATDLARLERAPTMWGW
jgi:site-specific DNA-methyltransferase (cytosine-N4-specific)